MYKLYTSIKSKLLAITACIFFVTIAVSCNQYKKNSTHADVPDENIDDGKALAAIYCASCHLLPDPSVLNAASWEKGVLPAMGPRLGIFFNGFKEYSSAKFDRNIGASFYPSQPVLNSIQWQHIIDYYTALAPDSLVAGKLDESIENNLPLFKPMLPAVQFNNPRICYVGIDTIMSPRTLLLGDVTSSSLYRFNNHLQMTDSLHGDGAIVDIDFAAGKSMACNVGVIVPNNGKFGSGSNLVLAANNTLQLDTVRLFDSLQRPVQMTGTDFNKDGKKDYLVCEYGNLKGALSWMENIGEKQYVRHVIHEVPGAIKAYIQDYNKDGLPDIYVLFAQGDESIFLYTNKGNGKFDENRLLRFPPYNGSSYFELADFNKDGFPDIVYTCGDNADYSAVLKPYHGVYIYLNNGTNSFTQQYFFHINGCFKAIARDFDNDGDLDIATISFFADYQNRPEEGFVYLQNNGNYLFKPFSVPETQAGRWLTMNAGDLDGDGKIDLVLGNFSAPLMIKSKVDFQKGPAFMVLKNMGR